MRFLSVIFTILLLVFSIEMRALSSILEYGVVTQECNNNYCDVIFTSNTNEKKIILENYPFESVIKNHSDDISEVQFSCGSPCRSSVFVNLKTNEIDRINMPFSFSKKYLVVAYVDDKNLIIKKLFHDNYAVIDVDFSPVAVLDNAILNIEFISNKSIKLTYLTTNKYLEETKVFSYDF